MSEDSKNTTKTLHNAMVGSIHGLSWVESSVLMLTLYLVVVITDQENLIFQYYLCALILLETSALYK